MKTLNKYAKRDLRAASKGNHNVHTLLKAGLQNWGHENPEDYRVYAEQLIAEKQAKLLAMPSYSGRNIRF